MSPTPQDWEAAGFRSSGVDSWEADRPDGSWLIADLEDDGVWCVQAGGDGTHWRGEDLEEHFDTEAAALHFAAGLAAVARQRDEDDA